MKKSTKIAIAVAAVLAAAALTIFVIYLSRKGEDIPTVPEVSEEVTEPSTEPETDPPTTLEPTTEYPENISHEYADKAAALHEYNKDVAGWVYINETAVDYPFTLDPGNIEPDSGYGPEGYGPNEYYLSHGLYGDYVREGTLFMDYRDVFGQDESKQSENIVIYGHNMANNTMFGSIRRYRQDYSFYDVSPFVKLASLYRDYDYVIFGFLITSGNWYGDFLYWNMEELDSKKDFDSYIESVRSKQMIDTGVDVKYGDKLLTLSTCYANEDNSRFIIVARRLRPGEVAGDMSTIERTAKYKKEQREAEQTTTDAE